MVQKVMIEEILNGKLMYKRHNVELIHFTCVTFQCASISTNHKLRSQFLSLCLPGNYSTYCHTHAYLEPARAQYPHSPSFEKQSFPQALREFTSKEPALHQHSKQPDLHHPSKQLDLHHPGKQPLLHQTYRQPSVHHLS